MKKIFTIAMLSLLSVVAFAQREKVESYKSEYGGELVVGGDMQLGVGSRDNGDYRFIRVNQNNIFAATNSDGTNSGVADANALPGTCNGMKAKIVKFDVRGNNKRGYVTYAIIGLGDLKRYQVQIDPAIKSGEIIVPGAIVPGNNNSSSNTSVADELLKLNELKKEGIISEEEFNEQKAKLLNK